MYKSRAHKAISNINKNPTEILIAQYVEVGTEWWAFARPAFICSRYVCMGVQRKCLSMLIIPDHQKQKPQRRIRALHLIYLEIIASRFKTIGGAVFWALWEGAAAVWPEAALPG